MFKCALHKSEDYYTQKRVVLMNPSCRDSPCRFNSIEDVRDVVMNYHNCPAHSVGEVIEGLEKEPEIVE